jgi:RNA polymerase sigma factor for flagellar operon FliA
MHYVPLSTATRREVLVALGLPIVQRLAAKLARRLPPNVLVEDLVGAGAEGLLRAVDGYDPRRYKGFEPYAEARIRGAMLDELRAGDTLTSYARRRLAGIARAQRALQLELGRPPSHEQVAERVGLPLDEYQRVSAELGRGGWLLRAGELDPDEVESDDLGPDEVLDAEETRARLAAAFEALPARSREVLVLYYAKERTQAQIGEMLGVTESRVCQILGTAAGALREALAA